MNSQPTNRVKFYADLPDGQSNKLFSYPVHNFGHAVDIVVKFKREGSKIRAVFLEDKNGKSIRILPDMYEDDFLHQTYAEKQRYSQMKGSP